MFRFEYDFSSSKKKKKKHSVIDIDAGINASQFIGGFCWSLFFLRLHVSEVIHRWINFSSFFLFVESPTRKRGKNRVQFFFFSWNWFMKTSNSIAERLNNQVTSSINLCPLCDKSCAPFMVHSTQYNKVNQGIFFFASLIFIRVGLFGE